MSIAIHASRVILAFAAAVLCLAADSPDSDPPSEVLVLSLDLAGRPVNSQVIEGLQAAVYEDPKGIALEVESVPALQPEDPVFEQRRRWMFESRYQNRTFKAIVAIGQASTEVARRYRGQGLPDVPILSVGIPSDVAAGLRGERDLAILTSDPDFDGTIQLIRQLLPRTRRIAATFGSTSGEARQAGLLRALVEVRYPGLELETLQGLTWEQMVDRCGALPENTVILAGSMLRDGRGRTIPARNAAVLLGPGANRPIFAISSVGLGEGYLGGSMMVPGTLGREAAGMLRRLLHGEAAIQIGAQRSKATGLKLDARQLSRWGIPLSRAPEGAHVRFLPRSLWRDHRSTALWSLALILLQAAMISTLLVERKRRKRAEGEARERLHQIAHMNRVGAIGQFAASLAGQIHQPLEAIARNTAAVSRLLERPESDPLLLKELLAEVAEDSARAGTVVQKMAGFLRRDPPVRRLLNLNSVVTATIDLFRSEAAAQAVEIQADLAEPPAWVEGDPIQLQQALLNLAANAMDALRPITGRLRVIRFLTSTAAGKSRITVQDTGSGFLPEQEARAFEPFYTTRQDGLGIGLPLARRIVEDHGGELLADSLPGWGAAFHLEFPAATPAGSPIASPSR